MGNAMPAKRKNRLPRPCSSCGKVTAKYIIRYVCGNTTVYCHQCREALVNRLIERIRTI